MGVSGLTIYRWEAGKSKPRRSQLPKIVAVRGIGKREAWQRLGMHKQSTPAAANSATPHARKRWAFKQTAAEWILSLFNGRKALTTGEINAA